ncbi:MAG: alkaline phosphatase family protein [Promethearchaeati archaeon SRVP18_Atabeyarchaeia-1]
MNLFYVCIDGMGDRPVDELGGKTPLEAASTPNLDKLANNGRTGLMYTVRKGVAPESDVAVISILGYDPFKYHTGRGPIESFGAGLAVNDGDLASRCNFATLGEGNAIIDRRAGRNLSNDEATELSKSINETVKLESHPAVFEFKNTVGHRCVLVIRSGEGPLSGNVSNTDSAYARVNGLGVAKAVTENKLMKCEPLDRKRSSKISADLVNEFVEKTIAVLRDHPVNERRARDGKKKANVVLTRDAGDHVPQLFSLNERYNVKFACLADMPVEIGIGRLAGMDVFELPPPSKDVQGDMELRIARLKEAMKAHNCFYIHIKGPDEPGHDGDVNLKKEIIEKIDMLFFSKLLKIIDVPNSVICVTADHSTPCSLKGHSDDPVPVLISGNKIRGDGLKKFGERECAKGSLKILSKGSELMPILMGMVSQEKS